MRSARGSASVNSYADRTVSRVLEASGHGKRGHKLSVNLGLGRTCSNGAPRHEISSVLRSDCVQEFASGGKTHLRYVQQKSATKPKALVDLETAVHVRIIDETLPANGRARFLEIDSHDDVEVVLGFICIGLQLAGVLKSGFDIVN